jgi:hypothetical protein
MMKCLRRRKSIASYSRVMVITHWVRVVGEQ